MRLVLQKHFECIDGCDASRLFKDWGFMVIPLSDRPIREVDLDAFLFTVKTTLPSDAKLVVVGGLGIQMGVLSGEYFMIFASQQWVRVAEGAQMPRLNPVQLREARRLPSFWDRVVPKRIREFIKGVALARSAGHSWRYSFYCARAFRFLSNWR